MITYVKRPLPTPPAQGPAQGPPPVIVLGPPTHVASPPPPEYIDCGEEGVRECEAGGCCGTVGAAPFRFLWSVVKLGGNGIGATMAMGNFVGLSLASVAVLGVTGCCSKKGREIGSGLGLSAVDNLRTSSIAIGNAVKTVFLGVPSYCAKCCCKERIETIRKNYYRCLETTCLSCCIKKTENAYRAKINSSCYMSFIRKLAGEKEIYANISRFGHHQVGSIPRQPTQVSPS